VSVWFYCLDHWGGNKTSWATSADISLLSPLPIKTLLVSN
jgi:hypothetical protein